MAGYKINLLLIMSKVFERLLLHRLDETLHLDSLYTNSDFEITIPQSNSAIGSSTKSKKTSKEIKYAPQYSSTFNKLLTKYGTEDFYLN